MATGYSGAGPPPPYSANQQVGAGNVQPQQFHNPVQQVELQISCRNLLDMDFFSKSDPFVVVYVQGKNKAEWREMGRTETIMDNLNPDFVRSFKMDYLFEEQQLLRFDVYDLDSNSRDLSAHDFIGNLTILLWLN